MGKESQNRFQSNKLYPGWLHTKKKQVWESVGDRRSETVSGTEEIYRIACMTCAHLQRSSIFFCFSPHGIAWYIIVQWKLITSD